MSDLKKKAKQLISLREKATQGEWASFRYAGWLGVHLKEAMHTDRLYIDVLIDSIACFKCGDFDTEHGTQDEADFIAYAANNAADIAKAYLQLRQEFDHFIEAEAIKSANKESIIETICCYCGCSQYEAQD